MGLPAERAKEDFRLRRLDKPEEFRAVEELQRLSYGMASEPPIASTIQRVLQDHGGLVLGAFADIHLAGAVVGFLGWDGKSLYHFSQLTAVRPEYQNHHVGFRLKLFQRDEVLRQGLGEIRWVLDPLQSRGAALSVRRLGARPDGYKVHYFGQLDGAAESSTESDRLTIRWGLSEPRVVDRLAGRSPTPQEDLRRRGDASAIVETEIGENGLRVPVSVGEPTSGSAHLEIPFDIGALRAHEPKSASIWRHAVRDAFRAAFDLGFAVDDFAVLTEDHERRSFYFLSRSPPTPAPS